MIRLIAVLPIAFFGMLSTTGAYGNDALYGDQPGKNAVFLRFVNALDTAVSIATDVLPLEKLGSDEKARIGPYHVIDSNNASSLTIHAKVGDAEIEDHIKLEAGTKMSVVLRNDQGGMRFIALSTPSETNGSRAVLSFINAAPTCGAASLVLDPAKVIVFANVPVDGERVRRINSVDAQLSVTCGALGTATARLERPEGGTASSLWLFSLGGHPALILGSDTLPGWHP